MYSAVLNEKESVNFVANPYHDILNILLSDKTTGNNILWATDNYVSLGDDYAGDKPILTELITGENSDVIRPRVRKSREEQTARIRKNAEVFTPSWICNIQNNHVDDMWFGYEGAFNRQLDRSWETNRGRVAFPGANGEGWEDYVTMKCLEITCGEAPYLVSRYDAESGDVIKIEDRIGRLDRKLRVINENIAEDDKEGWTEWTKKAYRSVYGYELQGDSLLLARENLLYTFIEYYNARFGVVPDYELIVEIAEIISWNIWQMDGLKGVVPGSCVNRTEEVSSFFGTERQVVRCPGCEKKDLYKHNGIYCRIMNWETGETERYVDQRRKG